MAVFCDGNAGITLSTWIAGVPIPVTGAVQGLGDNPGRGGLADPPYTGQYKSVCNPVCRKRIPQDTNHGFLANQFGEVSRPVFSGEDLVWRPGIL